MDMSRRAVTYVKRNPYTRDRCIHTPYIHQRNVRAIETYMRDLYIQAYLTREMDMSRRAVTHVKRDFIYTRETYKRDLRIHTT